MRGRVIVVMGVCGVGKSTFGRELAGRLGAGFVEADDHHAESSKRMMASGRPLTDAERWPWLDAIAAEVGRRAALGEQPVVVACSSLRRAYRDRLRAGLGEIAFVHLHGDADLIRARLAARADHFMPSSMLESQLATLEPLAEGEGGFALDIAVPVDALADRALARLGLPARDDAAHAR